MKNTTKTKGKNIDYTQESLRKAQQELELLLDLSVEHPDYHLYFKF